MSTASVSRPKRNIGLIVARLSLALVAWLFAAVFVGDWLESPDRGGPKLWNGLFGLSLFCAGFLGLAGGKTIRDMLRIQFFAAQPACSVLLVVLIGRGYFTDIGENQSASESPSAIAAPFIVSLLLGMPLAIVSLSGPCPKLTLTELLTPLGKVSLWAGVMALAGWVIGYYCWWPAYLRSEPAVMGYWSAQAAGCATSLVGGILVCTGAWRIRKASQVIAGIIVRGSADFLAHTEAALMELDRCGVLPLVSQHVGIITEAKRTGIRILPRRGSVFEVGYKTWSGPLLGYAAAIAYDAHRAFLFKEAWRDARSKSWLRDPHRSAWCGPEAEKKCLAFQLEVLKKLDAPPSP